MFNLYDRVIIKSKKLSATIVSIENRNGNTIYIAESDVPGKIKDGYGGMFPLFDCDESDLELSDD